MLLPSAQRHPVHPLLQALLFVAVTLARRDLSKGLEQDNQTAFDLNTSLVIRNSDIHVSHIQLDEQSTAFARPPPGMPNKIKVELRMELVPIDMRAELVKLVKDIDVDKIKPIFSCTDFCANHKNTRNDFEDQLRQIGDDTCFYTDPPIDSKAGEAWMELNSAQQKTIREMVLPPWCVDNCVYQKKAFGKCDPKNGKGHSSNSTQVSGGVGSVDPHVWCVMNQRFLEAADADSDDKAKCELVASLQEWSDRHQKVIEGEYTFAEMWSSTTSFPKKSYPLWKRSATGKDKREAFLYLYKQQHGHSIQSGWYLDDQHPMERVDSVRRNKHQPFFSHEVRDSVDICTSDLQKGATCAPPEDHWKVEIPHFKDEIKDVPMTDPLLVTSLLDDTSTAESQDHTTRKAWTRAEICDALFQLPAHGKCSGLQPVTKEEVEKQVMAPGDVMQAGPESTTWMGCISGYECQGDPSKPRIAAGSAHSACVANPNGNIGPGVHVCIPYAPDDPEQKKALLRANIQQTLIDGGTPCKVAWTGPNGDAACQSAGFAGKIADADAPSTCSDPQDCTAAECCAGADTGTAESEEDTTMQDSTVESQDTGTADSEEVTTMQEQCHGKGATLTTGSGAVSEVCQCDKGHCASDDTTACIHNIYFKPDCPDCTCTTCAAKGAHSYNFVRVPIFSLGEEVYVADEDGRHKTIIAGWNPFDNTYEVDTADGQAIDEGLSATDISEITPPSDGLPRVQRYPLCKCAKETSCSAEAPGKCWSNSDPALFALSCSSCTCGRD